MYKSFSIFLLILVIFSGVLLISCPQVLAVNASTNAGVVGLKDIDPTQGATPQLIIGNVIKAVLGVTGSLALFMFIYGGMVLIASHGNDTMVKKGKDILIWAIIGLVVILSSYALVQFVTSALES